MTTAAYDTTHASPARTMYSRGALDCVSPQFYGQGALMYAEMISNVTDRIEGIWLPAVGGNAAAIGLGFALAALTTPRGPHGPGDTRHLLAEHPDRRPNPQVSATHPSQPAIMSQLRATLLQRVATPLLAARVMVLLARRGSCRHCPAVQVAFAALRHFALETKVGYGIWSGCAGGQVPTESL
jgi:hypothetical protein